MNKNDIKELMKFFSENEKISKMRLKQNEMEIELEKEFSIVEVKAPKTIVPQEEMPPVAIPSPAKQPSGSYITSPMVGTFYQAPAPGSKPFAKVGDVISKGQTVAIIEAMKIMNDIEAEYDCKIVKILVEDGQPVEFDMPLYEVEKL